MPFFLFFFIGRDIIPLLMNIIYYYCYWQFNWYLPAKHGNRDDMFSFPIEFSSFTITWLSRFFKHTFVQPASSWSATILWTAMVANPLNAASVVPTKQSKNHEGGVSELAHNSPADRDRTRFTTRIDVIERWADIDRKINQKFIWETFF